ncbi:MAG: putative 4-hydroxybenzoate polyprenyltransferase [Planctomycetota bacterium]|nr:putative 4-hydroxybenzoate polyprenyltransferase [Planctomycetota bacterium]
MKRRFFAQLRETAQMIKISHSVFALPFALASAALAMRGHGGWSWETIFWIVLCAVFARTAAMAQNRLVDARLDAENPRTASRALPAGRVTTGFVRDLVLGSSVVFVLCAWMLNDLCLYLSPVVLVVLLTYPYAKRFTALSHVWLGASLGLAPVGAWVAVRGNFEGVETAVTLGLGVLLWTAGFDIIYACQDFDTDRRAGLHSVPARLGIAGALRLSVVLHVLCLAILAAALWINPHLGGAYIAGLAVAAAALAYEHAIVKPDDLSRVNLAFFTLNGVVSIVIGGAVLVDAFV